MLRTTCTHAEELNPVDLVHLPPNPSIHPARQQDSKTASKPASKPAQRPVSGGREANASGSGTAEGPGTYGWTGGRRGHLFTPLPTYIPYIATSTGEMGGGGQGKQVAGIQS